MMKLGPIASASLGFFLIFVLPKYDSLLIPIYASYSLNLFQVITFPVIFFILIWKLSTLDGIKLRRSEQFLFLSIVLIILARVISLLTADEAIIEQSVSIFRYVETLVLVYALANLFANSRIRSYFVFGLIIGVGIETIGGISVFFLSGGMERGFFITTDVYRAQTLLILICSISLINNRHKMLMIFLIVAMVLSMLVTMIRGALVLLIVALFVLFVYMYRQKRAAQALIAMSVMALALSQVFLLLPIAREKTLERIEGVIQQTGGIVVRKVLWEASIEAFRQHPITGIGSGGFGRQGAELYTTIQGRLPDAYRGYWGSTHNRALNILAETGIIGFIPYALWLFAVIGACIRVLKSAKISIDVYIISACLTLTALMISDFWSEGSFTPISNCLLAYVLGWCRENNIKSNR